MNLSAVSKKPKIIWLNVLFFSVTFVIAAIAVPIYAYFVGFEKSTIIATIIGICFCELSITAGYHRLWSHKSYESSKIIRFIYAIGGAFAVQNSALHWSSDHRIHHRHVDNNDKDPYSAKNGFWYSHIGWMLREYQIHRYHDYDNVRDLQKDPIIVWQHKYYWTLALITNITIPVLFGLITNQLLASILLLGIFRLAVSHHLTFFINSLAHIWGNQPYNDKNTAKDNPIIAWLTFGEGYHNFHHVFQYDYRNAIKWWQFDPTKWLIKTLNILGLAKNLKKTPENKIIKAIAQQQLNYMKKNLSTISAVNQNELINSIQQEYEQLIVNMNYFYKMKKEWLAIIKNDLSNNMDKNHLSIKYKELQTKWSEQQLHWQGIMRQYA